jgi:hypothetical protein
MIGILPEDRDRAQYSKIFKIFNFNNNNKNNNKRAIMNVQKQIILWANLFEFWT